MRFAQIENYNNIERFNLPVLLTVEGPHDAEFLRRISGILRASDKSLPNLAQLEHAGQLVILPLGGNGPRPWLHQLRLLGKAAFHLFDREVPPESQQREAALSALNHTPNRRALLTSKRSLENYLHGAAIEEACGVRLAVGDEDDVPELAARQLYSKRKASPCWSLLLPRTRKRLRDRIKRRLNRQAVLRMTPQRLAQRDPAGEVKMWLRTIAELVSTCH